MVPLEVAAHEITHALTLRTAGLKYEKQSGGLNEAFSDIMSKAVQKWAASKNAAIPVNWSCGSEFFTPPANSASRYGTMRAPLSGASISR